MPSKYAYPAIPIASPTTAIASHNSAACASRIAKVQRVTTLCVRLSKCRKLAGGGEGLLGCMAGSQPDEADKVPPMIDGDCFVASLTRNDKHRCYRSLSAK